MFRLGNGYAGAFWLILVGATAVRLRSDSHVAACKDGNGSTTPDNVLNLQTIWLERQILLIIVLDAFWLQVGLILRVAVANRLAALLNLWPI